MWANESVFYQIFPLGFCGAPIHNDGVTIPRISKLGDWADYIAKTGANVAYLSPIFESDSHGYDTRDYRKIDCRLGTNEDFAKVCEKLHKQDLKVMLDGVFNHVGRGFWAFQDVLKNREYSQYKDWFYINFGGNSNYNDNLWYEGWEGHFELVKLNLRNNDLVQHLFDCISGWVDEFDIDGLRLDVAYSLDKEFVKRLRHFCNGLKPDFFLIGEMLHGDYNQLVNDEMLHSVTNYECYKGLYSSFNTMNMFEIASSLGRQFGPENWTLYKGKHLLNFVDNHDVARIATILNEPKHLPLVYGLLFAMPGIPCVYYGSEWGVEGKKERGSDAGLRPCFEEPISNELSEIIAIMSKVRRAEPALSYGNFDKLLLTNKQFIFERAYNGDRILVAINADDKPFSAHFNANAGRAMNLLTNTPHDFGGGSELPPYSVAFWKVY